MMYFKRTPISMLFAITIALFILNSKQGFGQTNIVPNPSFETYTSCPTFGAQWEKCTPWNNVNMNLGIGYWGTPDYFTACGTGGTAPPNTFAGNCIPHTGSSMMAIVLYNLSYSNAREYIATPLSCTMTPGNTYTVSFWLSNGTSGLSPWCIRNIGIHFSSGPLSQNALSVINVIPQCEITTNVFTTSWVQYTFTVNPTSNWNYLTMGAFRSDAMNNYSLAIPSPGGAPSSYANYFVDDIEVIGPANSAGNLSVSSTSGNFNVCPGQSITLVASGANSYTWSNNSNASSITIAPTSNTVISVQAPGVGVCSGNSIVQVTVSLSPTPTINTIGTNTLCTRTTITITASGADTYQWSSGHQGSQIAVLPLATTVYTVTGTNTLTGCSSSVIHLVSVSSTPTLSVFGPTVACIGSQVTYSALGATVLNWSTGGTGPITSFVPIAPGSYSLTGINGGFCQASTQFNINLVECLSLSEQLNVSGWAVFPNPVNSKLNIVFASAESDLLIEKIEIRNMLGQNQKQLSGIIPEKGRVELDLSDLFSGVYQIRIETKETVLEQKFVKQ